MPADRKVYVMSDIHNDATRFKQMLEKIEFSKEDLLIIDGDIFDRGGEPVELYFEILKYPNIQCICGNHDEWVRREIYDHILGKDLGEYLTYNTYEIMEKQLTEADLLKLADWIGEMPFYRNITVEGRKYQIAHAQTYPTPDRIFDKRNIYMGDNYHTEFLAGRYELKDTISVVGHVPTEDFKIWKSPTGKTIRIDCGNGYVREGGRLGALRLNDGKEYYL